MLLLCNKGPEVDQSFIFTFNHSLTQDNIYATTCELSDWLKNPGD